MAGGLSSTYSQHREVIVVSEDRLICRGSLFTLCFSANHWSVVQSKQLSIITVNDFLSFSEENCFLLHFYSPTTTFYSISASPCFISSSAALHTYVLRQVRHIQTNVSISMMTCPSNLYAHTWQSFFT